MKLNNRTARMLLILTASVGLAVVLPGMTVAGASQTPIGYYSASPGANDVPPSLSAAPDLSPGELYSSPMFCSPDGGNFCFNVRDASPDNGAVVQTVPHVAKYDDTGTFEAIYDGHVNDTSNWPFLNHTYDKAWNNYPVVQFHYVYDGEATNKCISTYYATSTILNGVTGQAPLALKTCDAIGSNGNNETFFVWDRGGIAGYRMEAIFLTNALGNGVQQVTCIVSTDNPNTCLNGYKLATSAATGEPRWAHYDWSS